MESLGKIFGLVCTIFILSGCLSIGSGPLSNSISISLDKNQKRHTLPRGYCYDKSASSASGLKETVVITNCIAVNDGKRSYYSRRPVDTIIKIMFTQLRAPQKISQQKYLSLIGEKMEFKKLLTASSDKKLIIGEKKLKKTFLQINFQRIGTSRGTEYIQKYFFFVDDRVTIMTIVFLGKPRKETYILFENFIKKLI